jgi:NADH dehydrogenase/NADH:ubiquinone oxidoreductase subunit G
MSVTIAIPTVTATIDSMEIDVPKGTTILEAAKLCGINIPTLCYLEGLSPYGACRICSVEISTDGEETFKVVASCTYEMHRDDIVVRTDTPRIRGIRKMLAELLVTSAPNVKLAQDIAARMSISMVRFEMEGNRCILCGRCIRICAEQMGDGALAFAGRGAERVVSPPFATKSDICLTCGGCDQVCPGKIIPCQGVKVPGELCGRCLRLEDMPFCCPLGTFGCSCERNPL